jgi:hypothetical protein
MAVIWSLQPSTTVQMGRSAKPSATASRDIHFIFGAEENGVDIAEHAGTPVESTRRREAA